MLEGWIKSYRQLINWQHFQQPIVLQVWIAILHSANAKDGWLRGKRIRRGEWVTSTAQIMAICGIGSNNTVIDALNTLEESGEIKRERFGNATKITVCHYSKFQGCAENAQLNAQPTAQLNAQPIAQPTAQPTAHKQEYIEGKECKKEKKERIKTAPKERTRYEKIFEEVYSKRTGNPFAWSKRECIAINAIIGKIANMMIAQNKVPTDQDKEIGLRWFLEQLYNTGDAWIISNFVPHIIDAKFNEFYTTIKNGKHNGKPNNDNPANVSEEWLRRILTR